MSPRRRRNPLAALLILLAVLWVGLAIGSPLTARTTFLPTTILSTFAPWEAQAPNGVRVTEYCTADNIDAVQPGRALAARALRSGEVTGLDPYQVGGSNNALSLDTGVYDPVALAPFVALPLHVAPAYEKLLELLVVLLGMVLWARRLGLSTAAGVVGGFAFGTGSFMVVWTNWPQTSVACWIPMLFWAGERLAQERRLSSALLLALPVASMTLGGFPVVTGWAVYAVAVYGIVRLLAQRPRLRAVVGGGLLGALGAGLGLGLTAFQLLPFRAAYAAQDLGYHTHAGGGILTRRAIDTALFPNAYGGCGHAVGNVAFFLKGDYVETQMFVGSAALVLIVVALTGRLRAGVPTGPRVFLLLTALFLLNQMFFHDPLEHIVSRLPVFDESNSGRLRSVLDMCVAGLVTMGADRVVARAWRPRWWRHPRTAVVAAVWLLAAVAAGFAALQTHRADNAHFVGPQLLQGIVDALLVAAGTALVVLVAALQPRRRPVAAAMTVMLALLVGVQGAAYARGFWPRDPNSTYYPATPAQALLARALGGDYRVSGNGGTFRPGTATFYEQASPDGHAFATREWQQLLMGVNGVRSKSPTYLGLTLDASTIDDPILDRLAVRYVIDNPAKPILGTPVAAPTTEGSVPLSAGAPVSVPIPAGTVRGISLKLAAPLSVASAPYASLRVDLFDAAGRLAGSGVRRVFKDLPSGTGYDIAVTDATPGAALTARVSVVDDPHPTALAAHAGTAALGLVRPADDGLVVALSNGSTVYERTTALPLLRWAGEAAHVATTDQVAVLRGGLPDDRIVLAPGVGAVGSGAGATLEAQNLGTGRATATVRAAGAGYLVLADSQLPGWHVSVDGHPAALLDADHGLMAVAVPVGTHRVSFSYTEPGQSRGIAVTVAALVVYALLWFEVARRRWRRVRRGGPARRGPLDPTSSEDSPAPRVERLPDGAR